MNTTIDTYLTNEIGPLPFCPGCGHDQLLKALDKALVKLQLDPAKTVIVTDIGCIGLSDQYFITHGFHGLHGRSITYACGMKLARPELTVIVLMGDGGCGIGGSHLLNVARRNIDITLLVANNFNYGMTGGQHSVSTPLSGITPTTPMGNLESAMDLCKTAIAAGAGWVYRGTTFDGSLSNRLFSITRSLGSSSPFTWAILGSPSKNERVSIEWIWPCRRFEPAKCTAVLTSPIAPLSITSRTAAYRLSNRRRTPVLNTAPYFEQDSSTRSASPIEQAIAFSI